MLSSSFFSRNIVISQLIDRNVFTHRIITKCLSSKQIESDRIFISFQAVTLDKDAVYRLLDKLNSNQKEYEEIVKNRKVYYAAFKKKTAKILERNEFHSEKNKL